MSALKLYIIDCLIKSYDHYHFQHLNYLVKLDLNYMNNELIIKSSKNLKLI